MTPEKSNVPKAQKTNERTAFTKAPISTMYMTSKPQGNNVNIPPY